MKTVATLSQLKFHQKLRGYYPLCWKYLTYLQEKENFKIIIQGYDTGRKDFIESSKPYMHRWKPAYMKVRLAKFYLLDEWAKSNPLPLSMWKGSTHRRPFHFD